MSDPDDLCEPLVSATTSSLIIVTSRLETGLSVFILILLLNLYYSLSSCQAGGMNNSSHLWHSVACEILRLFKNDAIGLHPMCYCAVHNNNTGLSFFILIQDLIIMLLCHMENIIMHISILIPICNNEYYKLCVLLISEHVQNISKAK